MGAGGGKRLMFFISGLYQDRNQGQGRATFNVPGKCIFREESYTLSEIGVLYLW